MRLSINHIAELLERSSRTVHKYVGAMKVDNRRLPPRARTRGVRNFMENLVEMRLRIRLYLTGVTVDLRETFAESAFYRKLLKMIACKNSILADGEDPP